MHFSNYYRPQNSDNLIQEFVVNLEKVTDWEHLEPGTLLFSNRSNTLTVDIFIKLNVEEENGTNVTRLVYENDILGTYKQHNCIIRRNDVSVTDEWFFWDEERAIQLLLGTTNKMKRNLLMESIMNRDYNLVEKLLKMDVDINSLCEMETSALCYAIQNHHVELAKKLILLGADISIIDNYGQNLFHFATHHINSESFEQILKTFHFLIDLKIPIDKPDDDRQTPLLEILLQQRNVPELIKLLVENGANIEQEDGFSSILSLALSHNYLEIIKYLVDCGVNLNQTIGQTHTYSISFLNSPEACEIIEEKISDLSPAVLQIFFEKRLELLFKN